MIRHKHLSSFCLSVHHPAAFSVAGHFQFGDFEESLNHSSKLLICILLPLFLTILLKRSELSDHNQNAQQCSQRILFSFAWEIKTFISHLHFPQVCLLLKNLKLKHKPSLLLLPENINCLQSLLEHLFHILTSALIFFFPFIFLW